MTQDHPRIHGEHHSVLFPRRCPAGSPPHTRGTQLPNHSSFSRLRITPAYTGNTVAAVRFNYAGVGSPPHTRGTRKRQDACSFADRITPAYTGNTPLVISACNFIKDHPRIHGEHYFSFILYRQNTGSPPHTRGTPDGLMYVTTEDRITPAYTGNTKTGEERSRQYQDHPRIHGEHFKAIRFALIYAGSPPHTRGTRFFSLGFLP